MFRQICAQDVGDSQTQTMVGHSAQVRNHGYTSKDHTDLMRQSFTQKRAASWLKASFVRRDAFKPLSAYVQYCSDISSQKNYLRLVFNPRGGLMSYEPRCTICGDAVDLIESKTDGYGQAVHENCYVWSVELRKPRKPTVRQQIHGDDQSRPQGALA